MTDLHLLMRHLNNQSHGGRKPGGHDKLLQLIFWMEDVLSSLSEQEVWLRDDYPYRADQADNQANQFVQGFLEMLLRDQENYGPGYLITQLCETDGLGDQKIRALLDARLKNLQDAERSVNDMPGGDLDDHPF